MEHKNVIGATIVFALIIVGMFVFAYLKNAEIQNNTTTTPLPTTDVDSPYKDITRIDAKHFFIQGTHTLVGEIIMPTPCDLLNWDTRIAESYPEQVTIDFNVINHSESCTQVVTPQRFKVSFEASKEAMIKAMFEGRTIELNLIPAQDGESPDDFELFIKG